MKLILENWREYIKEEEEVNEIFGMGKKYIDFGTEHLDAIQQIPIAIDHAVRGLEHDGYPQEFYKEYLEKLIKKYENEVDPMLSRLMVAKGQIDKAGRTIDPFVAKAVSHYLPDEVPSWENDSDLIRQLIELVLNMRNKILGAYKRYRNRVSNMPPYKPKPGMHNLEKLMGQAKVREEGIMDFFKSDSTAPSNTDMSPEEREFHKQQFTFDAEDFQEMSDALKLYKVLMYGGRYRGTGQHQMRKSRKAWTQMGKAGRKRRLKEIAAFHDNILRPMADKAAGYASEIESGTFVDATPRNDYWLGGINPKRIRKMLPKWAKAFESALRVSANFYKNEAPKYGLEEWEPQPGLEDIKDFMDLASIQEQEN